jgi:hypothetical protein
MNATGRTTRYHGGMMKLLLTSAGIKNTSIHDALAGLLGRGLGLVDFSMFPHLDHEDLPSNSMASAEKWAASVPVPGYAIDDQTAIKVTDGTVEVVSEGHWRLFTPGSAAGRS